MKRFIAVLLARRNPVCLGLAAVVAVVCAPLSTYAFAQLPTNRDLAKQGVEPFASCAGFYGPATTTLTLSTRRIGPASATTGAPFFSPADVGRWIGLRAAAGFATVTAVADSSNATIEITQGFGPPGPYQAGTWGHWPYCYLTATVDKYGYNAGGGHQKGINSLNLVLDRGQQYSADRCSLAHDSHYWGPDNDMVLEPGPLPGSVRINPNLSSCNNDHWVKFCFMKIVPKTLDEEMLLRSRFALAPTVQLEPAWAVGKSLPVWEAVNACAPHRTWIELPTNPNWIREAAAICYGKDGQVIAGINGLVLDVSGWDNRNGANVIVWQKTSACNQKWQMVPGTGNPAKYGYEIRGLGGKCLGTPPGRRPVPGDLAQMWNCDGHYRQKWHHEHGQIRVQDRRTPRLCLDLKSDISPRDVIVDKCASIKPNVNPSQQWRFASP